MEGEAILQEQVLPDLQTPVLLPLKIKCGSVLISPPVGSGGKMRAQFLLFKISHPVAVHKPNFHFCGALLQAFLRLLLR